MYLDFLGLGIFNMHPHISHCSLMISGPVGFGASVSVLPTSVDHPSESEYRSWVALIFFCLRESRIFRLRLPFFLTGGFAAMGLNASLGVDVFNDFA